jgi:PIN domain nuclease of toxin-antitoxin system
VILVDSHIVIWLAADPTRLSKTAIKIISEARAVGSPLAIASCSMYEFALTVVRNRAGTNLSLDVLMKELTAKFAVLPLTPEIAAVAAKMPDSFPRDPFDRMIAATAVVHGAPLITADGSIRRSGVVPTIW